MNYSYQVEYIVLRKVVVKVYTYLQTHQVVYINYVQFFVYQKKKKDGASLRSFNLGEIPQITAVYTVRLRSNQLGSMAKGNLFLSTF